MKFALHSLFATPIILIGFANAGGKGDAESRQVGTVASVRLDDKQRSENLNGRLHFCVFDNGEHDFIYVGTKYGMWSKGEFDLSIAGKKVFTGKVPHLVYEGTILQLGDVLDKQPKSNVGIEVTRVEGWFK